MSNQPLQIHRPGVTLLPLDIKLTEVTRREVLKAIEQWEENPPSEKYAEILGAREDD